MRSRADARSFWLFGLAAALYAVAAWSVAPGFYDCCAPAQYNYVSPPPIMLGNNVQPASGSGELAVRGGQVIGGTVFTRDQPQPQAAILFPDGALEPPSGAASVLVQVTPYAPPGDTGGIQLEGNVYCITANTSFKPLGQADLTLMTPPAEPAPSSVFSSADRRGPWGSIGGRLDPFNYLMAVSISDFGCFAVGYVKPHPNGGVQLGGPILPLVVAAAIVLVLLAGVPLALRRKAATHLRHD
jgi:hypothetical protein